MPNIGISHWSYWSPLLDGTVSWGVVLENCRDDKKSHWLDKCRHWFKRLKDLSFHIMWFDPMTNISDWSEIVVDAYSWGEGFDPMLYRGRRWAPRKFACHWLMLSRQYISWWAGAHLLCGVNLWSTNLPWWIGACPKWTIIVIVGLTGSFRNLITFVFAFEKVAVCAIWL